MNSYERFNLLIDSERRTNKDEINTNFSVNLTNGYQVKMARLKSACIPLTFYNITSNNNHLFYQLFDSNISALNYEFSIPTGRYNVVDLVNVINQNFNNLQTVEYGYLTLSFNNNNGNFTFTFTAGTQTPALEFIANMCFTIKFEPLLDFMGFYTTAINLIGVNNILVSTNNPTFINTDYIKLSLSYLDTTIINIDNHNSNSCFFLEMDTNFKDDYYGKALLIQNIANDTGSKNNVYDTPINLQNFKVTLTDKYDNILDLNGVDWWCMIELITLNPTQSSINENEKFIPPNNPNNPSYLNKNNIPLYMRF